MKLAMTPRFHEGGMDQLMSIEKKYYPFFKQFGHNLHLIPFDGMTPNEYAEEMKPDAYVFAGGYRLYTPEIREFEKNMLAVALEKKTPVLGICCGMFTINSFFGGTLKWTEHHQAFDGKSIDITKMIHHVKGTALIEKIDYKVNSFHPKSVDKMGDGLKDFLISDDGEIEAFYNLEKKIIGLQFHPENEGCTKNMTDQIMKKFSDMC